MGKTDLSLQEAFWTLQNLLEIGVMTIAPAVLVYLNGNPAQTPEVALFCAVVGAVVTFGRAKGWNANIVSTAKRVVIK